MVVYSSIGTRPSPRTARWKPKHSNGAHSYYGLVTGENSYEQVAEAIRGFLEHARL